MNPIFLRLVCPCVRNWRTGGERAPQAQPVGVLPLDRCIACVGPKGELDLQDQGGVGRDEAGKPSASTKTVSIMNTRARICNGGIPVAVERSWVQDPMATAGERGLKSDALTVSRMPCVWGKVSGTILPCGELKKRRGRPGNAPS